MKTKQTRKDFIQYAGMYSFVVGLGSTLPIKLFGQHDRTISSADKGKQETIANPHANEEAGVNLKNFEPKRIRHVSTIGQLEKAIVEAIPGDLIEVDSGDYNNSQVIRIEGKHGTADSPILVRSAKRGEACITGFGGFLIERCAYLAIEGFSLVHKDVSPAAVIQSSHHCRFTRNRIALKETQSEDRLPSIHLVSIDGEQSHHNRIDHNLFDGKRNRGTMIVTGGAGLEANHQSTQYDRIDHNHFRDFQRGISNGFETIRLGSSVYSHTSGRTIVERNLFERCNGEAEIVSIKSNDNIVRHNTFRDCMGMLTLRNCHGCWVEGNYFFNDGGQPRSQGIRFFGQDHVIINNYLQDLDGSAIIIRTGDIERRKEPRWNYEQRDGDLRNWGAYQRPERALIAFNTIINCKIAFELGEKGEQAERYPLPARHITIVNNLVLSNQQKINMDKGMWEKFTIEGNIFYSTMQSADLGWNLPKTSYRIIDPKLTGDIMGMRPNTSSPAVNGAVGSYQQITHDITGQFRKKRKDIGAIEYPSLAPIFLPLTIRDIGPDSL